ncbi:MAG: asparagine synthase (glutamine-hydrolyzing) [candidate division Zixibacteria bacterium]|nr:asparagine synthase (glutamine-hydrolyzing) [candidate division Zixibacteria bacterium]
MCGICGILYFSPDRQVEKGILSRMTSRLVHRGPDEEGFYLNGSLGLGIRRLSIIDLETGSQPIFNEDKTKVIVYNGEIYNFSEIRQELVLKGHNFRTRSDTETIVHLYEENPLDFVNKLNGIFAFALYDSEEKKLILARDHAGIKPLFYYSDKEKFIFASEIKSLLAYPGIFTQISPEGLLAYLSLGYVPQPETILKGIKKLSPGHMLRVSSSSIKNIPYWTLNYKHDQKEISREEQVERLRDLWRKVIKRQLVSDVPIGVLLSGGLDSSLVVAFASEVSSAPISTFTVGYEGMGYYDERPSARVIAERFNTLHHEFIIKPEIKDDLPRIVYFLDEPMADSSVLPTYYISMKAREQVKVVLTGTGGDDIFAGYRRYYPLPLGNLAYCFLSKIFAPVLKNFNFSRKTRIGEYLLLLKKFFITLDSQEEERYFKIMSIFQPEEIKKIFKGAIKIENPFLSYFDKMKTEERLNQLLFVDFHTYLTDDLLVKEDRMTMAWSLEGRVPFLDKELIEFASQLPSSLKLKGKETKYILKLLARAELPEEIIRKPKHGFAFPIEDWLRKDLKEMSFDLLLSSDSQLGSFLERREIKRMIEEHQSKRMDYGPQIWALLLLELWFKQVKENF